MCKKGLGNIFPQIKDHTLDLSVDIRNLIKPPFQPVATGSLLNLFIKTAILVAITSTQRVGEIEALMVVPAVTICFKDKVSLSTHQRFLSKVLSEFHLNETQLLVFFPKPHNSILKTAFHILVVRRALAFYLDRFKSFRKSPRLFASFADRSKAFAISTLLM